MNYSICIGVEKYQSKKIPSVIYAENDATEFNLILQNLEFDSANQFCLLSQEATKGSLESHFRRISKVLNKEDRLFIYYAGHGFSNNGSNYITCYDTRLDDLSDTSIKLQYIIQLLSEKSDSIALFLDSCHSGLNIGDQIRGIYSDLNESELRTVLSESKYFVGFAACKSDEQSHPISAYKHGAWTYHLIEAFSGMAKDALEKNCFLTANSLQNYLSKAIPLSLKKTYTSLMHQTPWLFGGYSSDFLLADLSEILKKRTYSVPQVDSDSLEFRTINSGRIKSLTGFKQSHSVPKDINSYTQNFVEGISTENVKNKLEMLFNLIRDNYGFKRKEISTRHNGNKATIVTSKFEVDIVIEQSEEEPEEYTEFIVLKNISSPDLLFEETFNDTFDSIFDTMIVSFEEAIKIEEIIDSFEDMDNTEMKIDYPPDLSHCSISINGFDSEIFIYPYYIEVCFTSPRKPSVFIQSFSNSNKFLHDNGSAKLLS